MNSNAICELSSRYGTSIIYRVFWGAVNKLKIRAINVSVRFCAVGSYLPSVTSLMSRVTQEKLCKS